MPCCYKTLLTPRAQIVRKFVSHRGPMSRCCCRATLTNLSLAPLYIGLYTRRMLTLWAEYFCSEEKGRGNISGENIKYFSVFLGYILRIEIRQTPPPLISVFQQCLQVYSLTFSFILDNDCARMVVLKSAMSPEVPVLFRTPAHLLYGGGV